MRLIFIRHGEPDYSIDSLTEKGWREAAVLAERVRKWEITRIYCSPLGRAKDTARASLRALSQEAVIHPWLREFYISVEDPETGKQRIPWDFLPRYWTKVPQFYEKDGWFRSPVMLTGNVEDAFTQVKEGIDALLREYGYEREGAFYRAAKNARREATLVFFCHLGVTATILSHFLGIAQPLLTHGFFLAPASVTVLHTEEREEGTAYFRIQVMGDTSHLAQAGEPVSQSGYFAEPFQG
ncbi:MAG: histidine phosphatase family protein [Clostridium sp.]|jgi:probable phosphoglycerate mutase|nr:histidine phosphatase family protein [Clostridium sp.]